MFKVYVHGYAIHSMIDRPYVRSVRYPVDPWRIFDAYNSLILRASKTMEKFKQNITNNSPVDVIEIILTFHITVEFILNADDNFKQ